MNRVRGHHLLCMPLFSGKGYSQAFTRRMAGLIHRWERGEAFQLCLGQDDVCSACPNARENGGCALGTADVARRDRAALEVLGLSPGMELTWEQLMEKLEEVTPEGFQAVCGGCRWHRAGLCSYRLLQERAKR